MINTLWKTISKQNVPPYTNPASQALLFEVLVAFIEDDRLVPVLNIKIALNVLNKGWNCKNPQIAFLCEKGISYLEKLCQPVCPSLQISETFTSKGQENLQEIFEDETLQMMQQSIVENVTSNAEIMHSENNIHLEVDEENIGISHNKSPVNNICEKPGGSVQVLDVQILSPIVVEEVTKISPEYEGDLDVSENQSSKFIFCLCKS